MVTFRIAHLDDDRPADQKFTDRTVLNALNETRSYKRADTKELSIKFCDEKGKICDDP